MNFSQFRSLGSLSSRPWQIHCLVTAWFLVHGHPSSGFLHGGRTRGPPGTLTRALMSFCLHLTAFQKAPPRNTTTWGVRLTCEFGEGHPHSVSRNNLKYSYDPQKSNTDRRLLLIHDPYSSFVSSLSNVLESILPWDSPESQICVVVLFL